MLDFSEILLRLAAAALAGVAIGLNRELHDKPIGVRTLGIVALATAMIVLGTDPNAVTQGLNDGGSRVVQGILTGIGFLGAGVIVRSKRARNVHGLTSAACVWLTACVGVLCAIAAWKLLAVGLVLVFALLMFGGRLERQLHHLLGGKDDSSNRDSPHANEADKAPPATAAGHSSEAAPHQPGR